MSTPSTAGNSGIPIVDLAPLVSGGRPGLEQTAGELHAAFKRVGFAYVVNHGIPQDVVDEAFAWSRRFFALPQSVKELAPHPPYGWHNRGYSGIGREKASGYLDDDDSSSSSINDNGNGNENSNGGGDHDGRAAAAARRAVPDCKESFEMGSAANTRVPNIWLPEHELAGFRAFFEAFYERCYAVELLLLRAIAVGLGLDEDHLLALHSRTNNQIRLLHYPPVSEAALREGRVECIGAHTDFGTMTMLFQDDVGGL